MKPIIKPIEFTSPLSEAEARMALKELCGSKFYNCHFNGKVDNNSFTLIRFFFASLVLQEYIPYPNAINICIFNPSINFESSFLYFAFKSIFNFLLIVYIE